MTHGDRMRRFEAADLYVVITEAFCAGRPALQVLDAVLAAGVRLVQCREKDWDDEKLYDHADAFSERCRAAGAVCIIDDRLDIALAVDADGVHLGQEDLPVAQAHKLAPEHIIGASTHSLEQALAAQEAGASYVNIGPIFETQTKVKGFEPLGPEAVGAIGPRLKIPFSCMGGIKLETVDRVLEQGARHPAVVTAVTAADNPEAAARSLREKILAARKRTATA